MDNLKRKLVNCITESLNSDVPDKKYALGLDSHNYERFLKSDVINSNLKMKFSEENYIVHKFKKGGWEGRFIIDLDTKAIVSITTTQNLKNIPTVKDRRIPHYMQSCLYVINEHVNSPKQISFGDQGTRFCREDYEEDFNNLTSSLDLDIEEYTYYVVTYDYKFNKVTDITWYLMDKDFVVATSESLSNLIKPDFTELTSELVVDKENKASNKSQNSEKSKKGIPLGLKKENKKKA